MIKGTHNTMSYLKPENLIGKLFRWTAQCQDKDIETQISEGCRYFDLRIKKHRGEWCFYHGFVRYTTYTIELLDVLNKICSIAKDGNDVYVRVVYENVKSVTRKQSEDFGDIMGFLLDNYSDSSNTNVHFRFEYKKPYKTIIFDEFGDVEWTEIFTAIKGLMMLLQGPRVFAIEQENRDYEDKENRIISMDFV